MAKRMVTIVDPRRMKMSPGYQYKETDYVSVPALALRGTFQISEMVEFTVGRNADPRNIEMVLSLSKKEGKS